MSRAEVLSRIADAWNREALDYAVTHGLEGYPERLGRDLDVLVLKQHVPRALALATEVLERKGWRVARPSSIWGPRIVATGGEPDFGMIEVHTVPEISWRNTVFATRPGECELVDGYRIDPWLTFVKRAVLPILALDFGKLDRNRPWNADVAGAAQRLSPLFGAHLSRKLARSLVADDLAALKALAPQLRRACVMRSWLRAPVRSLRLTLHSLLRRLRQPVSACAPTVALVGPDGIGKSSLIAELSRAPGLAFTDVVTRHWRPGLLPQLGKFVGRSLPEETDEGLRPPRRTPGRFHWLRALYYATDTMLGTWFKDRVAASRQKLIVYDRCFLDMAVDPVRYGLSSDRGVIGLWRLLPKPELVVALRDTPDRIFGRKPELELPEIRRQLDRWADLADAGHVHVTLDVDAAPPELVRRLLPAIGNAFHRVNDSPAKLTDGAS